MNRINAYECDTILKSFTLHPGVEINFRDKITPTILFQIVMLRQFNQIEFDRVAKFIKIITNSKLSRETFIHDSVSFVIFV